MSSASHSARCHTRSLAFVPQVLGAQQPIDLVAFAAMRREVVLRLLERRVAAVARRDHIETGALHKRQVAGRGGVERPRRVGLHEGAFGAAGVPFELVHSRAQIVEHHARGLLDEREPRGDRASPEDRELLHAACLRRRRRFANEKARRSLTGRASIVALPHVPARRCAGSRRIARATGMGNGRRAVGAPRLLQRLVREDQGLGDLAQRLALVHGQPLQVAGTPPAR